MALIVAAVEGIVALITPGGTAGSVMVGARGVAFVNPPHSPKQFAAAWNKIQKANGLPAQLAL